MVKIDQYDRYLNAAGFANGYDRLYTLDVLGKLTLTSVQTNHWTQPFDISMEGGVRDCVVAYTRKSTVGLRADDPGPVLVKHIGFPIYGSCLSYIT